MEATILGLGLRVSSSLGEFASYLHLAGSSTASYSNSRRQNLRPTKLCNGSLKQL